MPENTNHDHSLLTGVVQLGSCARKHTGNLRAEVSTDWDIYHIIHWGLAFYLMLPYPKTHSSHTFQSKREDIQESIIKKQLENQSTC